MCGMRAVVRESVEKASGCVKDRKSEGEWKRYWLHMSPAHLDLLPSKKNKVKFGKRVNATTGVRSIEDVGLREMYDITLDAPHQYFPNFISSHQCDVRLRICKVS